MPRRGENIYKRKDGRWEGRCITGHNENGHATFQYFYGHSYGEVKEKLLTRYQKVKMDTKRQHGIYYSDILDAWLRNKYLSVKESSYGKYQHTVDYCHATRVEEIAALGSKDVGVETGDNSTVAVFALLAVLSVGGVLVLNKKKAERN